jgi:hypothetical protein
MIFTLLCIEYSVQSLLLPSLCYFHKLVFKLIWLLYCSNLFILLYTKEKIFICEAWFFSI